MFGLTIPQFDDIAGVTAAEPQPIPAPYHRFIYSEGFRAVSQPGGKYKPSSGSQMLQMTSSSPSEIGLGPLRENPCFRFDFQGISLGCDLKDAPCDFDVTTLRWDGVEEAVVETSLFQIPSCADPSNCVLHHLSTFGSNFSNLTGIKITLATSGAPKTWWADDFKIDWTDDDCSVAACRSQVPNTVVERRQVRSLASQTKRLLRWTVRG